jgi:predicted permease
MTAVGLRIFGALLRLLPDAFRRDMADAMAEAVRARAAENRQLGKLAALSFWLREYTGLMRVALTERLRFRKHFHTRTTKRFITMHDLLRETRFALRRLARAPGFTTAAFLTLALAIGAVVSIWAVVKNVMLDPLTYPNSDHLVVLEHGLPGVGADRGVNLTQGLYALYRDGAHTLDDMAMHTSSQVTLTGVGEPETLAAIAVTPGLARVLGVQPSLGRWFDADAGQEGSARTTVLSHALWVTRFGSDPNIVGSSLRLNGIPHEVIAVMPPGFAFPDRELRFGATADAEDAMIWTPLAEPTKGELGGFNYGAIARMAGDVTLESVRTELNGLIARLPEAFPEAGFARQLLDEAKLNAQPLMMKDRIIGSLSRTTIWVLLVTVGLVLVLACANVANLFLVRSDTRQIELAVRRALGAGRRGLAGQFLFESLWLSLAGGAAGVALAAGSVVLLRASAPEGLPRITEIQLDPLVLLSAGVLCVLVGLVLGFVPLVGRMPALAAAIHEAGRRSTSAASRIRARGILVATQVALASVLLVACGLMVRSFLHLTRIDPGFTAERVLTFSVGLPGARYPESTDALAFHDRLLERLNGLPGVEQAAVVNCTPLAGWCFGDPLDVEGRAQVPGQPAPVITMRRASPEYFETLGIAVQTGRLFQSSERDSGAPVAVINRALADLYFPGEDPIGKRVKSAGRRTEAWATIVGIVDNTATMSITETKPVASIFFPLGDLSNVAGVPRHRMTYIVRTESAPFGILAVVRAELRGQDPELALADVTSMDQLVADSGARIALTLVLLAIAAATALLLAAVGIYGVISYTITRRTGEIGVRLALGARPADVVRMIVGQGGVTAGAGLLVGLLAARAFGHFMDALLFGVQARDPATYTVVALGLGLLVVAATWLPARRAARLDPVSALRAD